MIKIFCLFILSAVLNSTLTAQEINAAVDAKDYTKAEQLIQSGLNVNQADSTGQFPLWRAIWNGDTKMVETLLRLGADANKHFEVEDRSIPCIHVAVQQGHYEIVKKLIGQGVNVNESGVKGYSPLMVAARNGRQDIAEYIVEHGGEIDYGGSNDQATALEIAASKGHVELIRYLVKKGADLNHQDKEKDTPLGEAAKAGFLEIVKYLVAKGADVTLKNQDGYTALDRANIAGQPKIVAFLKMQEK